MAVFDSLYIHVPFCASRCGYCAFYSRANAGTELQKRYLSHLRTRLENLACRREALASVYIGGGTPTHLAPELIAGLLDAVRSTTCLQPGAEFTMECNPESLSAEKAMLLANRGVTRVSLGVQSFAPRLRRRLERKGRISAVEEAVECLRAAAIPYLGIDLIYGIPGQSVNEWRRDLERAAALGAGHISTYALTPEEGTRLAAEAYTVPPDRLVHMWHEADSILEARGFQRYEVSNFALPGRECRHNVAIWHGATYLGCGPAASSFDGKLRWTEPASLEGWLHGAAPEPDPLSVEERAAELLAFGLRTRDGWLLRSFRERTGRDALRLRGEAIRELADQGLLTLTHDRVRPTRRGLLFADTIAERIL